MKNRLQGLIIGILIGIMVTAAAVQANGAGTSIEVFFQNLRFKVNGVEMKPDQDSFIYNGSTYVPIRFVSEALGAPVRYNGETSTVTIGKAYNAVPPMKLNAAKTYTAQVTTNKGSFEIELLAKDAPLTVNNFVALANDRFYDDMLFHRIIGTFVAQTGDPTGTGRGGPGYVFEDELDNGHKYEKGVVAMANAGPNTNGSQFFICTGKDCEQLNAMPLYTIFGKVSKGMEVIDAIAAVPVKANEYGEKSTPEEEVKLIRVEIVESE